MYNVHSAPPCGKVEKRESAFPVAAVIITRYLDPKFARADSASKFDLLRLCQGFGVHMRTMDPPKLQRAAKGAGDYQCAAYQAG